MKERSGVPIQDINKFLTVWDNFSEAAEFRGSLKNICIQMYILLTARFVEFFGFISSDLQYSVS